HTRRLSQCLQSFRCSRLLLGHRNAHEASQAYGRLWSKVKIVLREISAAAALRDERMVVADLPPRFVQLHPRSARNPNDRNPGVVHRGCELIQPGDRPSLLWDEEINAEVQNRGGLAQTEVSEGQRF